MTAEPAVTATPDGLLIVVESDDAFEGQGEHMRVLIPWEHASAVSEKIVGETMKHAIHEATAPTRA